MSETPALDLPHYHVPLTRARLTGTRTTRVTDGDPTPHHSVQTEVALVVGADPKLSFPLPRGDPGAGSDRQMSVTLADDGCLEGFSLQSTGRGPEIVKAVASVVGTLAGAALGTGAVVPRGPARDRGVTKMGAGHAVRETPAAEDPPVVARRKRIAKAVETLQDQLIDACTAAATDEADWATQRRPARIARELARLRAEADRVETAYRAWRDACTTVAVETDEQWLRLDLCPDETIVHGRTLLTILLRLAGPMRAACTEILRRFGVLVCVTDREEPFEEKGHPPARGELTTPEQRHPTLSNIVIAKAHSEAAVILRQPRAVMLAVYRADPDALHLPPRLVERTRQVVVDERSDYVAVPLGAGGWFGKQVRKLTVGPAGGLRSLDNADESALAAAASAAAAGPAAFTAGLDLARQTLTSLDALRDRGVQREIARLKAVDEVVRARVAAGASEASETDLLETASIRSQIAELEARRELAALENAGKPPSAAARERAGAEALRAGQLAQLEIDRQRAEIALLQAKADAARGGGVASGGAPEE